MFVGLVSTSGLKGASTQSFLVSTQSRRSKPAQQTQTKVYATTFCPRERLVNQERGNFFVAFRHGF